MKEKSVKLKKSESLLKEMLSEALAELSDERLRGLVVTDVDCSGGKYDADVYLDPAFITPEEQNEILKQLRLAGSHLQTSILASSGWFKCPKFHFRFDDSIERANRLESIFQKIKSGA